MVGEVAGGGGEVVMCGVGGDGEIEFVGGKRGSVSGVKDDEGFVSKSGRGLVKTNGAVGTGGVGVVCIGKIDSWKVTLREIKVV